MLFKWCIQVRIFFPPVLQYSTIATRNSFSFLSISILFILLAFGAAITTSCHTIVALFYYHFHCVLVAAYYAHCTLITKPYNVNNTLFFSHFSRVNTCILSLSHSSKYAKPRQQPQKNYKKKRDRQRNVIYRYKQKLCFILDQFSASTKEKRTIARPLWKK